MEDQINYKLNLIIGDPQNSNGIAFINLSKGGEDKSGSYTSIECNLCIVKRENSTVLTISNDGIDIEPDTLRIFRDDLKKLKQTNSCIVYFGDHDDGHYIEIIKFEDEPGKVFLSVETNRIDINSLSLNDDSRTLNIDSIIDQIDVIEQQFGPLLGHCGACGPASSKFQENYKEEEHKKEKLEITQLIGKKHDNT